VLSQSTEAYDRGAKYDHYRHLESAVRFPSVDTAVLLAEIYENLDLVAPEGIEEAAPHPHEPSAESTAQGIQAGNLAHTALAYGEPWTRGGLCWQSRARIQRK
jgi:hypothetical protein